MTHVADEGGKADWSPLHLQNDCFPPTTFKLVQSSVSSPCINSFREWRRGQKKVLGLWHKLCMRAHMHTDMHKHKPNTPTHPFVDLIEYRIKTDSTLRQYFLHHKEGGNTRRKEKLNWVWVQGQSEAVWTKVGDLPKHIYQFREKAPLSQPLQSCSKDGFL